MNESKEHWKKCPGFEAKYEISNIGRIRRFKTNKFKPTPKLLRPTLHPSGYYITTMYDEKGRHHMGRIHRLVALAFVTGKTDSDNQVHHKNAIKTDNRASNLQWVSAAYNVKEAAMSGRMTANSRHHNRKLNWSQVSIIRSEGNRNCIAKLARRFNVSRSTIASVKRGTTWNKTKWLFAFENGDGI